MKQLRTGKKPRKRTPRRARQIRVTPIRLKDSVMMKTTQLTTARDLDVFFIGCGVRTGAGLHAHHQASLSPTDL